MERVAFHHEGLDEIKKITGGRYKQYHYVNKYICASIIGHGAGFWPLSNRSRSITLPSVSRIS